MKTLRGFTLIELLATLTVMAIISAMLFPFYQNYTYRSKTSATFTSLKTMQDAMMRYAQFMDDFDPNNWGASNAIAGPWQYDTNAIDVVALCGRVGDVYGNRIVNDITAAGSNQTLKPSPEMFAANAVYFYRTGPITNMNFWPGFYRIPNNVNGDYVNRKGARISSNSVVSSSVSQSYIVPIFQ